MAASNEWTEWHLTPRGWERGTEKEDFRRIDRHPPTDRVLTFIYQEYFGSVHSRGDVSSKKTWNSDDEDAIQTLLKKHGDPPNHL